MRIYIGHPFPQAVIPTIPVAAFHVVGHELWVLDLAVLIDGEQGVLGYLVSVGLECEWRLVHFLS